MSLNILKRKFFLLLIILKNQRIRGAQHCLAPKNTRMILQIRNYFVQMLKICNHACVAEWIFDGVIMSQNNLPPDDYKGKASHG